MKKKWLKWAILLLLIFFGIIYALNIKVTTKQGNDYHVSTIEIPLYLKILDFFDRHYNYVALVKKITKGANTQEEKVIRLFEWTYNNIKPQPQELPVVDDHVWNIIIRGYGAGEQSSDVFTTLCNYAGADAFYDWIKAQDNTKQIALSFVMIDKQWIVFDQYSGNIFITHAGKLASVNDILKGNWRTRNLLYPQRTNIDYSPFFRNMDLVTKIYIRRSRLQSPYRRFVYQIKNWLSSFRK